MAPADLPKAGSSFDLPIALAVLTASGQLQHGEPANLVVLGEPFGMALEHLAAHGVNVCAIESLDSTGTIDLTGTDEADEEDIAIRQLTSIAMRSSNDGGRGRW